MYNQVGRRIFFDVQAGNVIFDTGEREGFVVPTTEEQDISTFEILSKRNRESFDCIELPFGAYAQDFQECTGYRVNPETKQLEFSYPDPNLPPEEQLVVYRKPLSLEVEEVKRAVADTNAMLLEFMEMSIGGM